jgi:hypothetical protein
LTTILWRPTTIYRILWDSQRSYGGRLGSTWRMINYATNDVHMKAF